MIFFDEKNFFFNRIEIHYYAFIFNTIIYKLICLAFVILKNTFYLKIIFYKSFAKTYLSITKFFL